MMKAKIFKNNWFQTAEGKILQIIIISGCLFLIFVNGFQKANWEIIIFLIVVMNLLFSLTFNYFQVDSKEIIIKNSIWVFWQRSIQISEIESVHIGQPTSRSFNSLRIYLKNNKSKSYTSTILKTSTWRELSKTLQKENINTTFNVIQ